MNEGNIPEIAEAKPSRGLKTNIDKLIHRHIEEFIGTSEIIEEQKQIINRQASIIKNQQTYLEANQRYINFFSDEKQELKRQIKIEKQKLRELSQKYSEVVDIARKLQNYEKAFHSLRGW